MIDEETKEVIGFDIDLMNAIAEKAGLDIVFQNVAWDPLLAGMANCQYDMAISGMTITPERLSSSVSQFHTSMQVRSSQFKQTTPPSMALRTWLV